ncbi:MAG: hypothetical protein PV344_02120, partial [Anaplasma sp.]|nr:hypothetical protein [Anaplasma sp.]
STSKLGCKHSTVERFVQLARASFQESSTLVVFFFLLYAFGLKSQAPVFSVRVAIRHTNKLVRLIILNCVRVLLEQAVDKLSS